MQTGRQIVEKLNLRVVTGQFNNEKGIVVDQSYKQSNLTNYSGLLRLAEFIGNKLADLTTSDSSGKFETVLSAKEHLFDKELFYGGVFAKKYKTNTRIVSGLWINIFNMLELGLKNRP